MHKEGFLERTGRPHADLSRLARKLTAREERRGRGPLTLETSALDEIGDVLAISRSTVDLDGRFASAWIKARLWAF